MSERWGIAEAQRFGSELRRVMTRDHVQVKELARVLGVDKSMVSEYRTGRHLPRVAQAQRIADALMSPHLVEMVIQLRTMTCAECDRSFVRDQRGGNIRRFCSKGCADRNKKRIESVNAKRRTGRRYDAHKRRADKLQAAVDAMCRSCAGLAGCPDGDCDLRSVSPLPFVPVEDVAIPRRGVVRRVRPEASRLTQRESNRRYMERKRAAA
jgi:transcriptional regulator with XRE-family HTH domain